MGNLTPTPLVAEDWIKEFVFLYGSDMGAIEWRYTVHEANRIRSLQGFNRRKV